MTKDLEVTQMRLADLNPHPQNPRKISDLALSRLQKSVERFGLVEPIVYNKRSGCIVGGHQRVKALKQLGEKAATVVVVDLDETDEKALNLALNNPGMMGEFTESIDSIAAEIREHDARMFSDFGFDRFAVDLPGADGDNGKELEMKELEVVVPVQRAWILIGIPIARYGEFEAALRQIGNDPEVFLEMTANNG
ncbi:MAG TPA: ParB N-terminal domain-containing protein [bacterium]|nr:ParB N-terminal domain-containing protein [bacterium]